MAQPAITPKQQQIGAPVENFHLTTLSGQPVNLQQFLEGKKGALVVFWSSVCSHCVRYDGYINSFTRQHPELGLVVVAARQGETLDQLRATVTQRNLVFPIVHDVHGHLASRWFAQQTPRVYLIDADGVLRYRGAIDNFKYPGDAEYVAYLEPVIQQFLAGQPITRAETASFGCAVQSVYYNLPKAL